jgi:MoaA/NifB/PqqE/SkfB family radical SAM enzyme
MVGMLEIINELEKQVGREGEAAAVFDDLRQNPPCQKPWTHLYVDWTGNAMVCPFHAQSVGNIKEQSIDEIWHGPQIQEIRKSFLSHDYQACNPRCTYLAERRARGHKILKEPKG